MIDIEPQVYTNVVTALRVTFPNIGTAGVENLSPSKFPFVCLYEADNYALQSTRDTASNENHIVVMYEANIFSNKKDGKKAEAKSIEAIIDDVMDRIGFTKTSSTAINEGDGSRYRRAVRYQAIVSKNNIIFRR